MNTGDEPLLSDSQWSEIGSLLSQLERAPRVGRPQVNNRLCLEGVLWVLLNGRRWRDLPDRFPSPATCWRRLRVWESQGIWRKVWRIYLDSRDPVLGSSWAETNSFPVATDLTDAEDKLRRAHWKKAARRFRDVSCIGLSSASE
jgi:putative transposase